MRQTLKADAAIDQLTEERAKRLQAESALAHNKAMIADLQTQIAVLQVCWLLNHANDMWLNVQLYLSFRNMIKSNPFFLPQSLRFLVSRHHQIILSL